MRNLIFKFDIHPVTIHLGNDQDESWGLSVLHIDHLDQSRALFQIKRTKDYWILGIFFSQIRIIIKLA